MEQRAADQVDAILASHKPDALSEEIQQALREIVERESESASLS
jgi:trimethylamine:corrinoid methyltransferase-like protein